MIPSLAVLIFLISVLGGLVLGIGGFGYGLVVVSLAGLLLDLREAALVNALAALLINATLLVKLYPHVPWRSIRPAMVAVMLAAPLGVFFVECAPDRLVPLLLAATLAAAVAQHLRSAAHAEHQGWHPVRLGVPCGLLSGALTGAFGTGGPPVVAFASTLPVSRFGFSAAVQVLLATGGIVRLGVLLWQGALSSQTLALMLWSLPGAALGAVLGLALMGRLSDRSIRIAVMGMMSILALYYAVQAAR